MTLMLFCERRRQLPVQLQKSQPFLMAFTFLLALQPMVSSNLTHQFLPLTPLPFHLT